MTSLQIKKGVIMTCALLWTALLHFLSQATSTIYRCIFNCNCCINQQDVIIEVYEQSQNSAIHHYRTI